MIFRNNWYCWDEQAFRRIASAIKEEFCINHAVARGWFFDKHFISSFCLKFFNSLIRKLFCSLWVCFCCQTFCLKFFNSLIRKLFCSLCVCFFLALRLIVRKPALVPALQDGGLVVSDEEKEKKQSDEEKEKKVRLTPATAPTEKKAAPSKPPPSLQAAPSNSALQAAPSNSADSSAPSNSAAPSNGLGPQDPVMLLGKWFSKFVGVCWVFSKFVMFLGAFVFLEHEFLVGL